MAAVKPIKPEKPADRVAHEPVMIALKYYVNGRPVRESTGVASDTDTAPAEAKRFLKLREGAVAIGAPISPRADRVRYDELEDDLREAGFRLTHLKRFFSDRRAIGITPPMITEYVVRRQQAEAANGTINRELATLSRLLRVAYRNGKLSRLTVIDRLEEAPPREGFFEPEQYQAVRKYLDPDLQVATLIAYTYGWRMDSEVLPLERRQLDLAAGTLRLDAGETKNDDGRLVYLRPELEVALREQLARIEALHRQPGQITPWLQRAFRRTAVRNMQRANVPRSVAMKMTGHRTEAVYRRYAIVNDADLLDATRRLHLLATGTFSGTSGGSVPTPAKPSVRI